MIVTNIIRRVFVEDEKAFLEIGPWNDEPSILELRTEGKINKEWFGEISLSMTKEFALALGNALIQSANELKDLK